MSEVVIEPAISEDLDELSNLLGQLFSTKRAIFGPTSRSSFTGSALFSNSPAGAAYWCCDVIEALSE